MLREVVPAWVRLSSERTGAGRPGQLGHGRL